MPEIFLTRQAFTAQPFNPQRPFRSQLTGVTVQRSPRVYIDFVAAPHLLILLSFTPYCGVLIGEAALPPEKAGRGLESGIR